MLMEYYECSFSVISNTMLEEFMLERRAIAIVIILNGERNRRFIYTKPQIN